MQKVALITGCSTGIGRELSLQLKRIGWQVVATARNPETLDLLEKAGYIVFPLDVTLPDQIESTVGKVMESCGRIDLLVNNAGYGLISPTLDIPLEGLQTQFKTKANQMMEGVTTTKDLQTACPRLPFWTLNLSS